MGVLHDVFLQLLCCPHLRWIFRTNQYFRRVPSEQDSLFEQHMYHFYTSMEPLISSPSLWSVPLPSSTTVMAISCARDVIPNTDSLPVSSSSSSSILGSPAPGRRQRATFERHEITTSPSCKNCISEIGSRITSCDCPRYKKEDQSENGQTMLIK